MNIYILEYVASLTHSYHSGGGAAVVAEDRDAAKAYVAARFAPYAGGHEAPTGPTDEEWAEAVVYPLDGAHEPRFFEFPDEGCC